MEDEKNMFVGLGWEKEITSPEDALVIYIGIHELAT